MKKKLLLMLPVAGLLAYVMLCSYSSGPAAVASIDGTGATTTTGCSTGSSCHGSSSSTTTVAFELDTAGGGVRTQYIGGGHYTIKITGTNTSSSSQPRFGFQLATVKATGAGTSSAVNGGTLASTGLPTSCQNSTSGSINIVEHSTQIVATTGTGGSGTTYSETIPWVAPVAGTGSIKIYGAINAVNYDFGSTGDKWNNGNVTVTEFAPAVLATITGTPTVCVGATTALSSTYSGGTWTSGSTAVAAISTAGVVTGIGAGTSVISYNEGSAGTATITVTVSGTATAGTIAGAGSVCQGASTTLIEAGGTPGGVWSSSATAIATVSASGVVTGTGGGSATITYNVSSACGPAIATFPITVNPLPAPAAIIGSPIVCSSATYTDATVGGTWSVFNGNATVAPDGTVTGVTAGEDTIYYSVTNTCGTVAAKKEITVMMTPTVTPISGPANLCTGTPITLSDDLAGGIWSSSATAIATVIATSGVVSGVSAGDVVIQYKVINMCGADSATYAVTVGIGPDPGTITGASGLCTATSTTLTESVAGGIWTSDNSNASVSGTGVVNGVAVGTDTIRYTVTNTCGSASAIQGIAISDAPDAGSISGINTLCQGTTVALTETVIGGTWSTGSVGAVTSVDGTGVVTGVAGGGDVVEYTVSNACGSSTAGFPVNVTALPLAGTIGGPSILCVGTPDTLTETVTGGTWSTTDTNITVTAGVVTATTAGVDTITYSVTNTCGTTIATAIFVVGGGTDAGTILGDTSICVGSTTIFGDSLPGGTWTVTNANAQISSTVLLGVTVGVDTVIYSITTGCGTISSSLVLNILPAGSCVTTSVASVGTGNELNVYPNPSTGTFTLTIPQASGIASVSITDIMGRVVASQTTDLSRTASAQIDLHNVAAGNYLIKVQVVDNVYREKITINK